MAPIKEMDGRIDMNGTVLKMSGISKSFGGVAALDGVDFELHEGEIHAIVGENGAGKSTLMKILLGIYRRDAGEVVFKGKPVNFKSPADALKSGISMIHQEISLVPEMDVAENILLGREERFERAGVFLSVARRNRLASELLEKLGIELDIHAKTKRLSVAQMQLVELARAVSYDPSIIIMDEPTSALTDREIELLYRVVRSLADRGVAVVFISHKLEEIFRICDRITVLRDGHYITSRPCAEVTKQDLINYIVGRKVDVLFEKKHTSPGEVVLEVKNLSRDGVCGDVSFAVHRGEVLGFCGLMGAGRSEILRAVFGIDRRTGGEILLEGKPLDIRIPKDAVRYGMAMVTEDRLRQGAIYSMSVMGNATISVFHRICNRLGFFTPKKEAKPFGEIAGSLSIKYDSPYAPITQLSGGNQQKVIIGRWLLTKPKVIFLDEPTRGIDVGSKAEIYKLIDELAASGIAVVMVSSELPEILSLCDRIEVVRGGQIVFECDGEAATQELLMQHAFGA